MLIRETLQFELKSVRKDSHGRFVIVEALVQDSPVLLINIYAPNKSNEAIDSYENLRTALLERKYSKTKARERRSRLWEIVKKLKERQEIFDTFPTESNAIQMETIKSEYNSLYDYITQGNVIPSRANWYEHGEKKKQIFLKFRKQKDEQLLCPQTL